MGKRPRGIRCRATATSSSWPFRVPDRGSGVDESKLPPADRAADGIAVDLGTTNSRAPSRAAGPGSLDSRRTGRRLRVHEDRHRSRSSMSRPAMSCSASRRRRAEGVTVSPDGATVYVTCEATNDVAVIDTKLEGVARIKTVPRPRS